MVFPGEAGICEQGFAAARADPVAGLGSESGTPAILTSDGDLEQAEVTLDPIHPMPGRKTSAQGSHGEREGWSLHVRQAIADSFF